MSLDTRAYRVGDALEELNSLPQGCASLIHLDDAWARPHRYGGMGVEYPTHDLEDSFAIVDTCWRVLEEGGWLIADADDWFKLKLENYLCEEYGNVAETYDGGGYRRTGGVTYMKSDGSVDRGGAGMYLRNSGYPVVFAHKGETDHVYEAARQIAPRPQDDFGWHSVKPLDPRNLLQPFEARFVAQQNEEGTRNQSKRIHNLECNSGYRILRIQLRDVFRRKIRRLSTKVSNQHNAIQFIRPH